MSFRLGCFVSPSIQNEPKRAKKEATASMADRSVSLCLHSPRLSSGMRVNLGRADLPHDSKYSISQYWLPHAGSGGDRYKEP